MNQSNLGGLIEPFVLFLKEKAHKFENIFAAAKARKECGGVVVHHWYEGNRPFMRVVESIDDLAIDDAVRGTYYVAPPEAVNKVAGYNRIYQLGLLADEEPKKSTTSSIETLGLKTLAYNSLCKAGISTIEDVFRKSKAQLLHITYFGPIGYEDLRQKMIEKGYADPNSQEIVRLESHSSNEVPKEVELSDSPEE